MKTDRIRYEGDCWVWDGPLNADGYPAWGKHRVYYEREYGPIPKGLLLHHRCRRKACVRPSHLIPVTKSQNNHFSFAEKTGQMSWHHLRISRLLHDQMTERMRRHDEEDSEAS